MTPTELADYVAANMPQTQPEINEFTARLNSKINDLPESVKGYIFDAIYSQLQAAICKRLPG